MANLRDIRRRIKSVKNTAQITRAMQLVAAAKMKKAQDQAMAGRDYSSQLNAVLSDISAGESEEASHPLLEVREGNRELVLLISTDKGLCGPLNTNLAKKLRATTSDTADYVTVGRKLRVMLEKLQKNILADFSVKDPVPFAEARAIASFLMKQFKDGKYDKVSIIHMRFINTLTQIPEMITLLPVQPPAASENDGLIPGSSTDHLFEPSANEVLASILPLYGLALGLSAATAALLVSCIGLGSALTMLPAGLLADRFDDQARGRRSVMLACAAITLAAAALVPLVPQAPWLVWPIVFIWGGAGGSLYTMAMIDIGAREKGITLVNSTAVLVLTYTLGGLAASSFSGALIDWSPALGFPLVLIGVAGMGLAVLLRTRHRQDI